MSFGRYDIAAFMSFFAYAAGSVVIPVALVEVAEDLGFPLAAGGMTAGGALHFGRTLPMVAALLGCGFAAGRWGKRRTFGWSVLVMGLGMAGCAVAPVYSMLFLALMLAGIGEGTVEGLATPFVQDLHPDEPGRYINFTHGFWSIGVLVTVLASGALLSLGVSWRLLTGAVAALALIPAWLLLRPSRGGRGYPDHPEPIHWTTVHEHAVRILRRPRFWLFFAAMFVAGGGEFCLTFWCASYIQLNFTGAAWAGGLGTASFAAGMVLGRTGWGYLIKQHQLRRLIILSALAGTAISLAFPVLTHLWLFFGLLFLVGVATAPFWPSVQSYCADRLPGTDTTMLFVLLSAAGIPGCGVCTWLMGYIGDRSGLNQAFYIVPACYLILAALMALDALVPAHPFTTPGRCRWRSASSRGPGPPMTATCNGHSVR
jgi:MFS family permease